MPKRCALPSGLAGGLGIEHGTAHTALGQFDKERQWVKQRRHAGSPGATCPAISQTHGGKCRHRTSGNRRTVHGTHHHRVMTSSGHSPHLDTHRAGSTIKVGPAQHRQA